MSIKNSHCEEAEGRRSNPELIVALDLPDLNSARKLLQDLKGIISFYKIGFEFFVSHGWKAVELVREFGGRVFLDLKLHDIPTTVAKTAAVICEHEVDMFNVHALGGLEMMKKTRDVVNECVKKGKKKPIVLGVTILTSHNQDVLSKELGIGKSISEEVISLAHLVKSAGLDGVVCSGEETAALRKEFPSGFLLVTPGVRPAKSSGDDQKRVMTPAQALANGSDYLVIGRPIVQAPNPRTAAEKIIAEIK
ncbi:MAG: orotidine-5'-phosphate decarboxylase [Candidatus Omnitrophica bacterium]|nr:orotidine-5'-phosphate decarboxylase [Candidatus Omnitrophota bacterium]